MPKKYDIQQKIKQLMIQRCKLIILREGCYEDSQSYSDYQDSINNLDSDIDTLNDALYILEE